MRLFRKYLFITGQFFLCLMANGQSDSSHLRISLLTCGPGDDLYSIWGHTGIRLIDSARKADVVFNYGTFDDRDPLFYLKFTRGIMLYSVTPYSYADFLEEYIIEKRSVTEQVLNLDQDKKWQLEKALWNNVEENNRYYPYHFYADNCTTRARNIILNNAGKSIRFTDIRPYPGLSTYRQLIHSYMNNSSQSWNRLGIDLLLGNHLDEAMTNQQAMFLPDYLMKGFAGATKQQQLFVTETNLLLPDAQMPQHIFFTPILLFSLLLAVMVALSFVPGRVAVKTRSLLDSLFFLFTGLLGLLILTLWLARVDTVCRNNYNILWALPTHTVIAFAINSRKKWVHYYWLFTILLNILLLAAWRWLPQEMNNSVLPLLIISLFRSAAHYRKSGAA